MRQIEKEGGIIEYEKYSPFLDSLNGKISKS